MRNFILGMFISVSAYGQAQLYVLQDYRSDTAKKVNVIYDSLPAMCDTFYRAFLTQDLSNLRPFVPQLKYLRATFDTLAIEYRTEQVLYRQQLMLRLLQKDCRKVFKYVAKEKMNLKKMVQEECSYNYAKDEKGNRYCYVTVKLTRRKKVYKLKYLAIVLNGHWFMGDDLTLKEIE